MIGDLLITSDGFTASFTINRLPDRELENAFS